MNKFGVVAHGIKLPLVQKFDNLLQICCDTIVDLIDNKEIILNTKDIIAVTESIVARAQGNYASNDDIAQCVKDKFGDETIGILFPIQSRNRFANLLTGITKNAKKVYLQMSYPADEVGNHFIKEKEIFLANINPYTDSFTEAEFRNKFPNIKHEFTGMDYLKLYKDIVGDKCEIILSNDPTKMLKYTKNIVVANIHDRFMTKNTILQKDPSAKILMLDEILNKSINGCGFNEEYGILGANYVNDKNIKLFPRDSQTFCENLQKLIFDKTKIKVECMVYGDGAFKDPVGKIWEFADPVVSPGFTSGLIGQPNEIKLKSFIDNAKNQDDRIKLSAEIKSQIANKQKNMVGQSASLGTTPRQLTDLLGSLSDLMSGSGDRGTPMILIQNYFTNYND